MANHPYLLLNEEQRLVFLAEHTDDDLLLMKSDFEFFGEECPLLDRALAERGLPASAPDGHLLPPDFFPRDPSPRRMPNAVEYLARQGLFLSFKYSVVVLVLGMIALTSEVKVLGGLALFFAIVSMFAPLFLAWFTPFYRPLRYTLVRPFNTDEFAKPLKRFLVRNVGHRCEGFTLSDRRFSPNRGLGLYHRFRGLIALLAVLSGGAIAGPAMLIAWISTWVRQSIRITTVLAPSGFLHLRREFQRRRLRAAQHFYSGGQCFNIRTIDEAWKYTMQALVHESDFVLVDLSFVRAGSHWEIDLLQLSERIGTCVAVCQVGHEKTVGDFAPLFPHVLYYDENGRIVGEDDLLERIRAAVV